MENNIFFSIVIPVYNVEEYLQECVDSVITQKYEDYEIILVDDGSKDSSGKLCDIIAENNSKVKVFHQENAGLSEARNTGIKNAKGKYLILLDSDDRLSDNSLFNIHKEIVKSGYKDCIVNRIELLFEDTNEIEECNYFFEDDLNNFSIMQAYQSLQNKKGLYLTAWLFVVKLDLIIEKDLNFYPGIYHEDEEWVPRLLSNINSLAFNNNLFYVYRLSRKGSITSTKNSKRMLDKIKITKLMENEYNNEKYSTEIRRSMKNRAGKIIFGTLVDFSGYKDDAKFDEIKSKLKERLYLLKENEGNKYKMIWVFTKLLGILNTSKLTKLLLKK